MSRSCISTRGKRTGRTLSWITITSRAVDASGVTRHVVRSLGGLGQSWTARPRA